MVKYSPDLKRYTMREHTQIRLLFAGLLCALNLASYPLDAYSETAQGSTNPADRLAGADNAPLRTVPFLTLRNKTGSDSAADYFGGERGSLTAGYCELERTPLNSLKPIAEKAPFYIPDEIVGLDGITELSIEDLWLLLDSGSRDQLPVLYTHGFYISFERGCRRALILKESLGLEGRFVLFSWPSAGSMLDYTQDEADLYWSVAPLRGVLTEMVDRFGAGNSNIVAHSLGTRGVMLALVLMAQAQQEEPLFNQVVLIAPDIDVGIFEQYLPMIRPLASNITVYVSSKDSPLALSRQVHGHPRLGEAGDHLDGLEGIEIIDLSEIPVRVPSGHVYHLYQSIVTEDLDQLINRNRPAAQRSNLKHVGGNQWRLQQAETE